MAANRILFGVVVLLGLTSFATAYNPHDPDSETIEGTWIVDVFNPAGQRIAQGLHTYAAGGVLVEDGNAARPTLRSPWHGSWVRLGFRDFVATAVRWNFDEAGNFTSTTILRDVIRVDSTLDAYSGEFTGRVVDRDGNVVGTPSGTYRARRLEVEGGRER